MLSGTSPNLGLLIALLALDPPFRDSASSALQNELFYTSPSACDLSGLLVVYNEDDNVNELRKCRNAKMKRWSRALRERRKQDEVAEPKEETMFHREETGKTTEPNLQVQEPGSSTIRATPGSKPTQVESLSLCLSAVASSGRKTSPSTHVHSSASRNIRNRPPLPSSQTQALNYQKDNGNMYRLNQVGKSASTREFITLNQRKHSEYAIDNYAM